MRSGCNGRQGWRAARPRWLTAVMAAIVVMAVPNVAAAADAHRVRRPTPLQSPSGSANGSHSSPRERVLSATAAASNYRLTGGSSSTQGVAVDDDLYVYLNGH